MDDFDEDEESTEEEPDEEYETDLAVSLAFDDVEETVEMPQAPEDVPMPEIQPIEGIELDQEDTCRDKCNRCLKDWKWKWWLIFLIVLVMMGLAIWMLTEEHNRLDAEINARTYGLSGTLYFVTDLLLLMMLFFLLLCGALTSLLLLLLFCSVFFYIFFWDSGQNRSCLSTQSWYIQRHSNTLILVDLVVFFR